MATTDTSTSEPRSGDARKAFWLRQYATAFANRDKRAAAVALQFAQAGDAAAGSADAKQEQLG